MGMEKRKARQPRPRISEERRLKEMPEKLRSFFGDPALRYISSLTAGVQKLIFSLEHACYLAHKLASSRRPQFGRFGRRPTATLGRSGTQIARFGVGSGEHPSNQLAEHLGGTVCGYQ